MLQRKDDQRRLGLASECFLPALDQLVRLEPVILEQAKQPLSCTSRVAGEHDLMTAPAQLADMIGNSLVNVGLLRSFGREIRGRFNAEPDRRR